MKSDDATPQTIDEYIAGCAPEVRPVLEKIRATIRKAAPDAKEKISYRMPTFTLEGNLVHFAAFKHHIGLFPPVRGDESLMRELLPYAGPKGNLRFPLDRRIPYGLIGRIVKARVRENLAKTHERRRTSEAARSVVAGSAAAEEGERNEETPGRHGLFGLRRLRVGAG